MQYIIYIIYAISQGTLYCNIDNTWEPKNVYILLVFWMGFDTVLSSVLIVYPTLLFYCLRPVDFTHHGKGGTQSLTHGVAACGNILLPLGESNLWFFCAK
jgi:hypothetical protein